MRTLTLLGYDVTVPDEMSYELDNHYIEVADLGGNPLGEVALQFVSGGDTYNLEYTTNLSRIRMNIREVVRAIMEKAREDGAEFKRYLYTIRVNGTLIIGSPLLSTVAQGKTLASRRHFTESDVLIRQGETEVMLATPYNTTALGGYTIGNVRTPFTSLNWGHPIPISDSVDEITLDTVDSQQITITIDEASSLPEYGQSFVLIYEGAEVVGADGNTYIRYYYEYNGINQNAYLLKQSALYDVGDNVILNFAVNPATLLGHITDIEETGYDVTRGELGYGGGTVRRWKVRLHRTCAKEKEVWVEWHNSDGMRRICSAQVLSDTMKAGGEAVRRIESELRSPARRLLTENTQTIRLGFENVPHGAYLEDILISDTVRIYNVDTGDSVLAVPTTQSLGKIDDSDVAIEFEILS